MQCLGVFGEARAAVLLPAVRRLCEEKLRSARRGTKTAQPRCRSLTQSPPPPTVLWDKDKGGTSGQGTRRQGRQGQEGEVGGGAKQTDRSGRDLLYLHASVSHEVREHKRYLKYLTYLLKDDDPAPDLTWRAPPSLLQSGRSTGGNDTNVVQTNNQLFLSKTNKYILK